jgi:hypothetical protein
MLETKWQAWRFCNLTQWFFMIREKSSYSFLRSLVEGQDHSFFKDLTGVFCSVGGTLVILKNFVLLNGYFLLRSYNLYQTRIWSLKLQKYHKYPQYFVSIVSIVIIRNDTQQYVHRWMYRNLVSPNWVFFILSCWFQSPIIIRHWWRYAWTETIFTHEIESFAHLNSIWRCKCIW